MTDTVGSKNENKNENKIENENKDKCVDRKNQIEKEKKIIAQSLTFRTNFLQEKSVVSDQQHCHIFIFPTRLQEVS